MGEKFDFSGWATRNDIRCSDGRIIRHNAFIVNDGQTVPLVWNHQHNEPANVLGHALLENRDEGVYAYCSFNDTEAGLNAKKQVIHGDITALSIYANQLKQQGSNVVHGLIREVSLVLAGANPGAFIDSLSVAHSADGSVIDEEAIIFTGEEISLEHTAVSTEAPAKKEEPKKVEEPKEPENTEAPEEQEEPEESKEEPEEKGEEMKENVKLEHAEGSEKTVQEVFDTLTEEQKTVVYAIIGQAIEDAKSEEGNNEGGNESMKHNVFETEVENEENVLSHSDIEAIFTDAKKNGSLKDSVLEHTGDYGIEPIGYLFPDAKNYTQTPQFIKRNDGWVSKFMNGVHKSPFSRVKTIFANITEDDARAKGYVKGNRKMEEVITLLKRETVPTTIYKKQKLDRDDVVDITSFDVVAWLKAEMRPMLEEEIARAALVGDGRSTASDDKISELNIRPIWKDDPLYTINAVVSTSVSDSDQVKAKNFIKKCIQARKDYKGSGKPVLFTTEEMLTNMLLIEDTTGRDIYDSEEKLRTKLRVNEIIPCEVMEGLSRVVGNENRDLAGIMLNLDDYNIGADKGGEVNMFDDFDIDFNQMKYLMETRCSGALVKPYSAIVIEFTNAAHLTVEPEDPTDTVLGKVVNTLQDDIVINDHSIEGTLKYVTGYTGYSSDPAEQSGNYLVLKFDAPSDAVTKVNLLGSGHNPVTLDSDMNCVFRVDSKRQKIKVEMTSATKGNITKIYELNGLNLEKA